MPPNLGAGGIFNMIDLSSNLICKICYKLLRYYRLVVLGNDSNKYIREPNFSTGTFIGFLNQGSVCSLKSSGISSSTM